MVNTSFIAVEHTKLYSNEEHTRQEKITYRPLDLVVVITELVKHTHAHVGTQVNTDA